jgi:ubiquilin
MEAAKIKVTIRQSSGDQFEVEVNNNAPVSELKEQCASKQDAIKSDEMRLIFKGKILKDEMTLDEYKIADGLTVHMVKGSKAGGAGAPGNTESSLGGTTSSSAGAEAQPNPFAGMGGMPGMGMGGMGGMGGMPPGMMGMGGMGGMGGGMGGGQMPNPDQMSQMMSNPMVQQMLSDPAVMQNIISSNPMLKQMADSNPQLRAMLNDP